MSRDDDNECGAVADNECDSVEENEYVVVDEVVARNI